MKNSKKFKVLFSILAVLLLNFILSFSFSVDSWFRVSADLLILLIFLAALTYFSKRNLWSHFISISILVIGLYRLIDKVMEFTFNSSLTFSDIYLLPELSYLIDKSLTSIESKLLAILILLLILVSYFIIWTLTNWLANAFFFSPKKTTASVFIAFIIVSLFQFFLMQDLTKYSWTRGPLMVDIFVLTKDAINFKFSEKQISNRLELENKFFRNNNYNLAGLKGINVFVIYLESYGAILIENQDLVDNYKNLTVELQSELEKKSFLMVTGYSEAPRSSWLSRLSFSTGSRIYERVSANLALISKLTTLNQKFYLSGYHTISVMPGVKKRVPKIESFFDFKQQFSSWNFDWPQEKSANNWAEIPDQYVLEWLGKNSTLKKKAPIYLEIVLSSSHSPYGIVPPYISKQEVKLEDWSAVTTKEKSLGVISHLKGTSQKYMVSIEYSLKSAFQFIERYLGPEDLIIVIGDHQPPALRTDSNLVPVHIISSKKSLLIPFKQIGFQEGLFSSNVKENIRHEDFAEFILDSYSCCQKE